MYRVSIRSDFTSQLLDYLAAPAERMAFLLSRPARPAAPYEGCATAWEAHEAIYLSDSTDYTYQGVDGMELADDVRPRVLRAATKTGAALIEIHSHGASPWPAEFSRTDLQGLRAVAPQILWRLPDRPYIAIVIQEGTADALIWTAKEIPPVAPKKLIFGHKAVLPTGLSAMRLQGGAA